MKKKKFSEAKIIKILKAGEAGLPVADISRQYGVGQSTYYKWKAKYAGIVKPPFCPYTSRNPSIKTEKEKAKATKAAVKKKVATKAKAKKKVSKKK